MLIVLVIMVLACIFAEFVCFGWLFGWFCWLVGIAIVWYFVVFGCGCLGLCCRVNAFCVVYSHCFLICEFVDFVICDCLVCVLCCRWL